MISGVWVLAQVFGGNALGRLGIAGKPDVLSTPSAQGRSGQDGRGSAGSGSGGGGGGSW